MAKPPLDLIQNQNPQKFHNSKDHKRRAKGMSFLAFLFSVFCYISIFYIFNLSPSQNFKNSKFWFFISNTLILIIAADYGAFSSSSKERRDILYEEYLACTSLAKNNSGDRFIPAVPRDPETVEENVSMEEEKHVVSEETRAADDTNQEKEPGSKESQEEEEEEEEQKEVAKNGPQDDEAEKQMEVNGEAESETENAREGTITEENDEFSRMSNEELNRRVEEFIWKLKRQIRLQEV